MLCQRRNTHIKLLEQAIDSTTLSEIQKATIKARLCSLLREYDARAHRFSLAFNTFRITITVGSLIVPALLSVQYTSEKEAQQTMSQEVYWIVWVVSLLVTISNGIMSLLKIDKKYFTLNTTYQHLMSESWQFVHLSGLYSGSYTPTIPATHQNQYVFFCNKVEKIRMKHIEDEYYKAAEQTSHLNEVIVPPTLRNRLPYQENSELQVNGGGAQETTTIRRNPQTQQRSPTTPLQPSSAFGSNLHTIVEESTNHE
jgi:hypothetical protein